MKEGIVAVVYEKLGGATTLGPIKISASQVTYTPTLTLKFPLAWSRIITKASFNAVTREVVLGYGNSNSPGYKVYSSIDIDTGASSEAFGVDCQYKQYCLFVLAPVSIK